MVGLCDHFVRYHGVGIEEVAVARPAYFGRLLEVKSLDSGGVLDTSGRRPGTGFLGWAEKKKERCRVRSDEQISLHGLE